MEVLIVTAFIFLPILLIILAIVLLTPKYHRFPQTPKGRIVKSKYANHTTPEYFLRPGGDSNFTGTGKISPLTEERRNRLLRK